MSVAPIIMMMAHQNQMRMREQSRIRREEDRRRRKRLEEKRKREAENQHRKTSPVLYTEENWQQDRCLKAISMQPTVKKIMEIIEEVRPNIVKKEQEKIDEMILKIGYEYEVIRQELEVEIKKLKKMGISIEGKQYELTRLSPLNTKLARPKQVKEFLGSTFIIMDGQPIELNLEILSQENYFEKRYTELNPDKVEIEFNEKKSRMKRYLMFAKYLKFLLRTYKYILLSEDLEFVTRRHERCELRRRELESYNSLNQEQLLLINSYFNHLAQLTKISSKLTSLFQTKRNLDSTDNENIYKLTIEEKNMYIASGGNTFTADDFEVYIDKALVTDDDVGIVKPSVSALSDANFAILS